MSPLSRASVFAATISTLSNVASLLLVAKGPSPAITSVHVYDSPLESLKLSMNGNLLLLSLMAAAVCLVALIGAEQRVLLTDELRSLRPLTHGCTTPAFAN